MHRSGREIWDHRRLSKIDKIRKETDVLYVYVLLKPTADTFTSEYCPPFPS